MASLVLGGLLWCSPGWTHNLVPAGVDPCWRQLEPLLPADDFPQAQYLEKFNGCVVLIGKVSVDVSANDGRAAGEFQGWESCPNQLLGLSNAVVYSGHRIWTWECAGLGEIEGVNWFERTGEARLRKGDSGYMVDNWIELKTTIVDELWQLKAAGTTVSGPLGSPPVSTVGGTVSLDAGPVGVSVSLGGSSANPLVLGHKFLAPPKLVR